MIFFTNNDSFVIVPPIIQLPLVWAAVEKISRIDIACQKIIYDGGGTCMCVGHIYIGLPMVLGHV